MTINPRDVMAKPSPLHFEPSDTLVFKGEHRAFMCFAIILFQLTGSSQMGRIQSVF